MYSVQLSPILNFASFAVEKETRNEKRRLIFSYKGGEKHTGGGRESGSDAWKNYMRRSSW